MFCVFLLSFRSFRFLALVNKQLGRRALKRGWSMVYCPYNLVSESINHRLTSFPSQYTIESMVYCSHLQILSTPVGYEELARDFEPIRNGDIAHQIPTCQADAPPKLISVKFTRRDTRNRFYGSSRKLANTKIKDLPDLSLTSNENGAIFPITWTTSLHSVLFQRNKTLLFAVGTIIESNLNRNFIINYNLLMLLVPLPLWLSFLIKTNLK